MRLGVRFPGDMVRLGVRFPFSMVRLGVQFPWRHGAARGSIPLETWCGLEGLNFGAVGANCRGLCCVMHAGLAPAFMPIRFL